MDTAVLLVSLMLMLLAVTIGVTAYGIHRQRVVRRQLQAQGHRDRCDLESGTCPVDISDRLTIGSTNNVYTWQSRDQISADTISTARRERPGTLSRLIVPGAGPNA